MTDLEINKALALAIGWDEAEIFSWGVMCHQTDKYWHRFDYRDWNVIGPIAEKFDAFPKRLVSMEGWWADVFGKDARFADTPQKAIALAVIGAKK